MVVYCHVNEKSIREIPVYPPKRQTGKVRRTGKKYDAKEDYECIDGSSNGTEHPGIAGAGGAG